jgi:hypothetical protein
LQRIADYADGGGGKLALFLTADFLCIITAKRITITTINTAAIAATMGMKEDAPPDPLVLNVGFTEVGVGFGGVGVDVGFPVGGKDGFVDERVGAGLVSVGVDEVVGNRERRVAVQL